MLDRILQSSIRNRVLVVVATLVLALVGARSLWQLPIDAVPDITNNQVQINVIEPAFLKSRPAGVALDMIERFPGDLAAMCREEGVEFFDMRRVWDAYVHESYRPVEHFLRDPIHANSRGKAVLARILGRYFAPK